MRTLKQNFNRYTKVVVMDEPGDGGANHEYYISRIDDEKVPVGEFGFIKFQKGPLRETTLNGGFIEDLLAIVIDRLESFQSGEFACKENAIVLRKMHEGVHWLNHRTKDRIDRNVEGKLIK